MTDEGVIRKILKQVDEDETVRLAMDLVDIPSPTGREGELGRFILKWFADNGFEAVRQDVEKDRMNAIGIVRGTGGGLSLIFNGHMDTVLSGTEEDLRILGGIPEEFRAKAFIRDGKICGQGIANMKGSIAAFMIAGKAILKSGVKLRGDLIFTSVAGEISTAPVGSYQGPEHRGEGVGTRHLLSHGIQGDYAICTDGSEFAVSRAQAGVAYFRISTQGEVRYTPYTQRAEDPERSHNAIIRMTKVIEALEAWAREYEARSIYPFADGVIEPKANIGCIESGVPYHPSLSPGVCSIYVDVRLPPGRRPLEVRRELEGALGEFTDVKIEMFRSQMGYEARGVDGLVRIIGEAHEYVRNSKPPQVTPPYASMWTDTNLFNQVGIPCVKFGPTPTYAWQPNVVWNVMDIKDIVDAAKMDAIITLEVCSKEAL